jgi:four helix bundle protein
MSEGKTHKDLEIWQRGMEFVSRIYDATKYLPRKEEYGLKAQMRRAAVSCPSNIAEGAARSSKKEYVKHLYIALGSLSELETQLFIAEKLEYLSVAELIDEATSLRRMTLNLIKYLKKAESEGQESGV